MGAYAVWAPKEYHSRDGSPKAKITNPAGGQWSLSSDAQRRANWLRARKGASLSLAQSRVIPTIPVIPAIIAKSGLQLVSSEENGHM